MAEDMKQNTAKRAKLSHGGSNNSSSSSCVQEDPIVGLDVCGKVYYCHQSTLVSASPYFASRFKGDFNASISYVDPQGRNIFFLERSPSTFPYIFDFMLSPGRCCSSPPDFYTNPSLIRNLRDDALFFGLEGLSEILQVTKSFRPEEGNQGVLYWLGTKKGKTENYKNPPRYAWAGGWTMKQTLKLLREPIQAVVGQALSTIKKN